MTDDKKQQKIIELAKLLKEAGFKKMKKGKNTELLYIKDNIAQEVVPDYFIEYLVKHFTDLGDESIVEDILKIRKQAEIKSLTKLMDPVTQEDFLRDEKNKAYLPFKNGVCKITKERIELLPYSKINKLIWREHVIDHNYSDNYGPTESEFWTFLANLCNNEKGRMKSLFTILGYLMCGYKDPSLTKAVIIYDQEMEQGAAHGGRGKSLITEGIGRVVKVLNIPAKNFNPERTFAFQQVNDQIRVINFDDAPRNFKFQALYPIITGAITVEKKNLSAFTMERKYSPKIVITSNHFIRGEKGFSDERRKVEFEVSDHYGEHLTPMEEFGHRLFDDWTEEEWSKFYSTMAFSIKTFFLYELVEPEPINLPTNKIISATSAEFKKHVEDNITLGKRYNKKDLFEAYPNKEGIQQNTFTIYLKSWADIKGYKVSEQPSNGNYYIQFNE